MPHICKAQLNPTGFGSAEYTYSLRASIRTWVTKFTSKSSSGFHPRPLHPGDEIRLYDEETGEAIGGFVPRNGNLVWRPFRGRYSLENL